MRRLQPLFDKFSLARRRRRGRAGEPSGVLFVASGGLGDTILLSHVVDRFCQVADPGEKITLLLRTDGAKTAFLLPETITVETIDFGKLSQDRQYRCDVADDLYARHFRLAVSLDYLRHPRLDEFLLLASDAAETVAMIAKPWAKYTHALAKNQAAMTRTFDSGPPVKDKLIRWTDFANWLTNRDLPPPRARVDEQRLPPIAPTDRPTVYIQAFSAVRQKQPTVDVFRAILAEIPADWVVRFAGAPGEDTRNPEYQGLFSDARVSYDDTTFAELVPKLRSARMVVSVDTAFLHLAIAVGTPTLGLASAAYVDEIVPYAPACMPSNARFVYHDMPCRSCLGDCTLPAEGGRYPCVARLSETEVVRAVTDLIADGAG